MSKHLSLLTGVTVILLTVSSCEPKQPKVINEGQIVYGIEYDSLILCTIDKKLLPSSLTVRFCNNNTINIIDALSGAVTISIISQPGKREFSTLLKVFDKKLYHSEPYVNGQYPAMYARMPKVIIDTLVNDCKFLGYRCKKAMGYFAGNPDSKFEIIYTNEINIENPNMNTPFENIDGVMLGFSLRFNRYDMKLKALSITETKVDSYAFNIPADYKKVDYQTMTDLIYLLQQ